MLQNKGSVSSYLVILLLLLMALSCPTMAQVPVPGQPQSQPVVLQGGTFHTATGKVIENGTLIFEKGKITYIGTSKASFPTDAEVVNTTGKHIYPGLILTNSTLGLREVDAVRATKDYSETDDLNPNARTIVAYNTDSDIIPTVRSNGILLSQVTPRGGIVSGLSSVVMLDAWNWEDAAYATDEGMHLYWIPLHIKTGWWAEPGPVKINKERDQKLDIIKNLLADAAAYAKADKPANFNLKLAAFKPVFEGSRRLYVHADGAYEIQEALHILKELGVPNITIVGGEQAWKIADKLANENVSVILSRLHRLPYNSHTPVFNPYKSAAILQKAGVLFCIDYEGDMEAMGSRNLPFVAGTAAAYGLTKEEALAAVSLNAAKILSIDSKSGSLEEGKDANIVVSSGDLLDMRTNDVIHAWLQGRRINLDNKQKALYQKFKDKYK